MTFSSNHKDFENITFRPDGAPPCWHRNVGSFLNNTLSQRWIGETGPSRLRTTVVAAKIARPYTLLLSLWDYIKDMIFVSPLATSLDDFKSRITAAVNSLDEDTLRQRFSNYGSRLNGGSWA